MSGGAAGAGKYMVLAAIFQYPLLLIDRGVSIAKVCVLSQAVTVAGEVLSELLYTFRSTADTAADVATEAGSVLKYGIMFDAASRLTTMMLTGAKSIPFLIM